MYEHLSLIDIKTLTLYNSFACLDTDQNNNCKY